MIQCTQCARSLNFHTQNAKLPHLLTNIIRINPRMPGSMLNYAVAAPRTGLRRIVAVIILIVFAIAGNHYGPRIWHQSQVLYWQHRCMTFSPTPDTVMYDEHPATAQSLLSTPDYFKYPLTRLNTPIDAAAFSPSFWAQLYMPMRRTMLAYQLSDMHGATVFLHERISPCGNRRLVQVAIAPQNDDYITVKFFRSGNYMSNVIVPGTMFELPKPIPRVSDYSMKSDLLRRLPQMRFYAGQPDPNDASKFTIRYQMWGQEDIADGQLNDDDTVTLKQRKTPEDRTVQPK